MKTKILLPLIFFVAASSLLSQTQTTVCRNNVNRPILDFSTVRDTILINLPPASIVCDVNVIIDTVTHTWDSDMRFYI